MSRAEHKPHQELRDFVERCDHTSIGLYRVEFDRLADQHETFRAALEEITKERFGVMPDGSTPMAYAKAVLGV